MSLFGSPDFKKDEEAYKEEQERLKGQGRKWADRFWVPTRDKSYSHYAACAGLFGMVF